MRTPAELLALIQERRTARPQELTLNVKQQAFYDLVLAGKSCVLIGSAGTGKTACLKNTLQAVAQLPTETPLKGEHKYLRVGSPSSVCVAYTRRAVQNIARATGHPSCLTIHKTLEYSPTYEEVFDTESGELRTTMRFRPLRTQHNPLEANINRIIIFGIMI